MQKKNDKRERERERERVRRGGGEEEEEREREEKRREKKRIQGDTRWRKGEGPLYNEVMVIWWEKRLKKIIQKSDGHGGTVGNKRYTALTGSDREPSPDFPVGLETFQRQSLADVKPRLLRFFCAVDIGETAEAEPISAGWVDKAVDRHWRDVRPHLEDLSNLNVQLIVGDAAPVVKPLMNKQQEKEETISFSHPTRTYDIGGFQRRVVLSCGNDQTTIKSSRPLANKRQERSKI